MYWRFDSHPIYISDSRSNKKWESDRADVSGDQWLENVTEIQEDIQEVIKTLEDDEDPHHGQAVALATSALSRPDHCRESR